MAQAKYSNVQVAFHWLTVLLILGLIGSGLAYSFEFADDGALAAHQWMGQGLIVILGGRFIARALRRLGPDPTAHAAWEKALSSSIHFALYAALLVFVVTGYVSASALRDTSLLFPVDLAFARSDTGEMLLETHYAMKWVLLALLSLHIAGAIKHLVIDRDQTLSNMWFSTAKDP